MVVKKGVEEVRKVAENEIGKAKTVVGKVGNEKTQQPLPTVVHAVVDNNGRRPTQNPEDTSSPDLRQLTAVLQNCFPTLSSPQQPEVKHW